MPQIPLHDMLIARRKALKLSAEAMGARFDVSRNWIQRLESGDMELRVSQLAIIAEAYEVSELELLRHMAPDILEQHRRTIKTDTTLSIAPSPEFWEEVGRMREDIGALTRMVAALTDELHATRTAAASAARRAGRVEKQLAPLTEQLAMTARDFERARERDAAYMPAFLEESTEAEVEDRPRAQLRLDGVPES